MIDRRGLLIGGSALVAGGLIGRARAQEARDGEAPTPARAAPPGAVVAPNVRSLPRRTVGGVQVYHLVAEPVQNVFCPGLEAACWGYNGSTPGPVIEAVEGERVRIFVTNRLPEPTTVHWHAMIVPSGMDGVGGLSQPVIEPTKTFVYEFDLLHAGTFMYHSHFDEMIQIAMGLQGMFVVHPRRGPRPDRDYAIMLAEWLIEPGQARPDPLEMSDFNVLTMNGKSFPATTPMVAARGERVRIRLGNLGPMSHHPIHLHGFAFNVVATDGGPIPRSAQHPEATVLVPVGSTRDIEFIADNPGDWAMHCHMNHHIMNQMGHQFPNMLGARTAMLDARMRRLVPGYMSMGQNGMAGMATMRMPYPGNSVPMLGAEGPHGVIDMGGMMTILKVRDRVPASGEVGWYESPEGTVAREATDAELREAGVEPRE